MQREVLYVGADDSNHAAQKPKYEIIVATFSFLHEDSIVRRFPNTRDYRRSAEWIGNLERDYRLAILTKEEYAHSACNLIKIVPDLITSFLDSIDDSPRTLKIYLDGILNRDGKVHLRDSFSGVRGIQSVVVDNFCKKRRGTHGEIIKGPNCPSLVYHADVLANNLLSLRAEDLFSHEKLVKVD